MIVSAEIFKKPDSARLFTGQLLSQICDKMTTLGLVWVIAAEGSPASVPWFLAAGALPHLGLAWVAGSWASALGPLRTVVWTDLLRGLLFVLAGVLWTEVPADHRLHTLFLLTVVANIAGALFNPAVMTLPMLLSDKERIGQVTAALDACLSFAMVLGPAIAALLYPAF